MYDAKIAWGYKTNLNKYILDFCKKQVNLINFSICRYAKSLRRFRCHLCKKKIHLWTKKTNLDLAYWALVRIWSVYGQYVGGRPGAHVGVGGWTDLDVGEPSLTNHRSAWRFLPSENLWNPSFFMVPSIKKTVSKSVFKNLYKTIVLKVRFKIFYDFENS